MSAHQPGTRLWTWSSGGLLADKDNFERQIFEELFPLDAASKIANYWNAFVKNRAEDDRGPFHSWLREAALETVRQDRFRDQPSRLDVVFAFRGFADAIRFACHHRFGPNCYLHEFRPDQGAVMADMHVWDSCDWQYELPEEAFNNLILMAESYWSGVTRDMDATGMRRPELLVLPPVVITEVAIPFQRER
jgi:hypothetical protein